MEKTHMFNDVSLEESYDIDGGSTKAAAIFFAVAGAVCGVGSYVASKTGNSGLAVGLGCAGTACGLASAWLAIAPIL
jgi:hypothetical protein